MGSDPEDGNNTSQGDSASDEIGGMLDSIKDIPSSIVAGISGGPIGIALTAVTKIGEGIMDMMTKIMQSIIDASPFLQGVLKIVQKMFSLILMPIGNMIAKLLLPLAITMANKTIKVMEKYANAGPDELAQAATDSFSVITDSIIQMAATVLVSALAPLLVGVVSGIVNGIGQFFGGSGGTVDYMSGLRSATDDLTELLDQSATGTSSVLDQFGLTVTTGNKAVGSSTSELATVIYSGADSIEDGFQATTSAIVIGSTEAIDSLSDYNIANAGLVTTINTTTTLFSDLNETLTAFKTQTEDATNNTQNTNGSLGTSGGWDWWQWGLALASPVATGIYMAATGEPLGGRKTNIGNTNNSSTSNNGGSTNINFYGNVYDKSDITDMVNKANTAKLRGSY